ncbi:hypothetical protein OG802_29670 [Streptomyces sp. NBC_00704]|nr:hypothetical protein [Streptomyces sp. NBC_00704]
MRQAFAAHVLGRVAGRLESGPAVPDPQGGATALVPALVPERQEPRELP